jgi:malate dehydrogenase
LKIGVFGAAGRVGAACAAQLLLAAAPRALLVSDRWDPGVRALANDLSTVAASIGPCTVRRVGADGLAEADTIVMTASVPHPDGQTRASLLGQNLVVLQELLRGLPAGWSGTAVMVSNPVDALVWAAAQALPSARVLGYTLNDSLRFAQEVAAYLGRPGAQEIDAVCLGEHGGGAIPVWSRLRVDGQRYHADEAMRAHVQGRLAGWFDEWQRLGSGITTTWSSASGVLRMIKALAGDSPVVLPVSVAVSGAYGLPSCALTLPVALSSAGVMPVEWDLDDAELAALARTASRLSQVRRDAGCLSLLRDDEPDVGTVDGQEQQHRHHD